MVLPCKIGMNAKIQGKTRRKVKIQNENTSWHTASAYVYMLVNVEIMCASTSLFINIS